jgi:hypothetical protein
MAARLIMTQRPKDRLTIAGNVQSIPMSVLAELLDRVRAARGHRPVVVFDLDSTLFSTQERNHAILQEFAEHIGAPGDLRAAARALQPCDMGWNVVDDLKRRGFRHAPTLARLGTFWRHRFFTDDYLRHDQPLPGAVEYVNAVRDAGATVYYLTGRDEPGMGRGTRASLEAHGFPLEGADVFLRLKPSFDEADIVFKRRVLAELHAIGAVVAAFENEPANANLFAESFPDAWIVFVETICAPDPPPLLPRIVRVRDFRR